MNTTAPKPFVFVLMPFDPEFDDIYQLGIKPACKNAGAYAERVDEQLFAESILERVYNQISKADVIIADMTGRNPNVFYETGYAHALGKKVILLTQNTEDIPFDLKHYPHIVYGGRITDLLAELEKRVKWAIQQPDTRAYYAGVEFFISGKSLLENPNLILRVNRVPTYSVELKIDAHNSITKQVRTANFQVGLITDDRFIDVMKPVTRGYSNLEQFEQQDGKILHLLDTKFNLLPGSWKEIYLELQTEQENALAEGDSFSPTLRLFSETGVENFPFSITIMTVK